MREVELAAVRLDEASKGRVALDKERLELDRVHHERLAKLRAREEEVRAGLAHCSLRLLSEVCCLSVVNGFFKPTYASMGEVRVADFQGS